MEENKAMNLVDKKVEHGTFGDGKVVSNSDHYIKVDFESGTKKFVFPDVFGKFMTLKDKKSFNLVKKKLEKKEEIRKAKVLKQKQEKALERERQMALAQEKQIKKRKVNPKLQSVFWCKDGEEETIFQEWEIFIGRIKNGQRKGEPRKLARMNDKSACLLTKREADMEEEDRQILGVFMVEKGFKGNDCVDGYIKAHPDYRLKLSEEESEHMLFWNYYIDGRYPDKMTWNSGRQRYFDNIWMAQILRDVVLLREDSEDQVLAQKFLENFCKVNRINIEELPVANGPLISQA